MFYYGFDVISEFKRFVDVIFVNGKCDDEIVLCDFDDVIVEFEEEDEMSKLVNEVMKLVDDFDDVIVEFEGED